MNLKQIFKIVNNFKLKIYQPQICIDHYYFGINYVNIQGRLEILNFEFQIYEF
jgi:hypothetical protein